MPPCGAATNVRLARDTYRIRLDCPELGLGYPAGQFSCSACPAHRPLLGRPFALYDTVLDAAGHRSL